MSQNDIKAIICVKTFFRSDFTLSNITMVNKTMNDDKPMIKNIMEKVNLFTTHMTEALM